MKILRFEEFTPQYPVLRITYEGEETENEGEETDLFAEFGACEDLPMIEVAPDEDKPGYWVVNENRLTPFQKELFITACDWCTAEGGSLSATPTKLKGNLKRGEDNL